jgi:hypothetical protein
MPPKPKAEGIPTIMVLPDGKEQEDAFPAVVLTGDTCILSGVEFIVRRACWVVEGGHVVRLCKLGVVQ